MESYEDFKFLGPCAQAQGQGQLLGPMHRHSAGPCQLDRGGRTLSTGTGSVVGWRQELGATGHVAGATPASSKNMTKPPPPPSGKIQRQRQTKVLGREQWLKSRIWKACFPTAGLRLFGTSVSHSLVYARPWV